MTELPSLLRPNNTPLDAYTTFFYPFLIDGYLGIPSIAFISWLLWKTLQWTWVCNNLFEIFLSILLGMYPDIGLPNRMVILFKNFWGTSILISIATTAVTNSGRGSHFLHILIHTCYFLFYLVLVWFSSSSHPLSVRRYVIMVLNLISPVISDVMHFFISFLVTYNFFGELSIQIFCLFFNLAIFVAVLSCGSPSYILDIKILSDTRFEKIFSHPIGCLSTLLIIDLAVQRFLSFL